MPFELYAAPNHLCAMVLQRSGSLRVCERVAALQRANKELGAYT